MILFKINDKMNIQLACLVLSAYLFGEAMSQYPGVCYGILGCFNITKDFHHYIFRPVNKLPTDPQYYNITIVLYRRSNPTWTQRIGISTSMGTKGENVPKSWFTTQVKGKTLNTFDGRKGTKFVITGYRDTPYFSNWMGEFKDELLTNGDYNVFIVDWSNATRKNILNCDCPIQY